MSRQRFLHGMGIWALAAIVLLLWLGSGLYIVGPGEKGVELRFGKFKMITDSGLQWRFPSPIDSHHIVNVERIHEAEIGFRTFGDRTLRRGIREIQTVPQEALMLTTDENIVEVHLFVQYRVSDPLKYLFRAKAPDDILRSTAEVALRNHVGQRTIDFTMTEGRGEVQVSTRHDLQQLLDLYKTGLSIVEARLTVVDAPSEVRDSFHDVVRALEDRSRLVQEAEGYREKIVPEARGEAARILEQAEAFKQQRLIRAQGDASKFLSILREYRASKDVTRERLYLETVEKILSKMELFIIDGDGGASSALPFLPLRELVGTGPATNSPEPSVETPRERGRR